MNDDDIATVYDALTGETTTRPLTDEELAEREENRRKFAEEATEE